MSSPYARIRVPWNGGLRSLRSRLWRSSVSISIEFCPTMKSKPSLG
jgi:hypothetical protein